MSAVHQSRRSLPKPPGHTSGPPTPLMNSFAEFRNAEGLPNRTLNVSLPRQQQPHPLLEQPDRHHQQWNAERQKNNRDAQHQRHGEEDARQQRQQNGGDSPQHPHHGDPPHPSALRRGGIRAHAWARHSPAQAERNLVLDLDVRVGGARRSPLVRWQHLGPVVVVLEQLPVARAGADCRAPTRPTL